MKNYQVLDKSGNPITTDVFLHPGEVIHDEVVWRKIKKADFADSLNITPSQLSELLHGKRHVGADMALRLEKVLNIPAEYWMRLQTAFDIAVERQKMAVAVA